MEDYVKSSDDIRELEEENIRELEEEKRRFEIGEEERLRKVATEFEKARKDSFDEKERETIKILKDSIKENPKILEEIQSFRRITLGLNPSKKTLPPKQVVSEVKKPSPSNLDKLGPSNLDKLEQDESGEAEKIFDIISKDFKKFINQNDFDHYVDYALYKYNTLFLLSDPNPVIQRIGKLFNEKFTNPKLKIVQEIYKIKKKKIDKDKEKFKKIRHVEISTLKNLFPVFYSDFETFKKDLKEYKLLSKYLFAENRIYLKTSENMRRLKTFLIDKLGESNFDLFTYFIASYFYQADKPDIEFISETLAESPGFSNTLGSEYVKLRDNWVKTYKGKK